MPPVQNTGKRGASRWDWRSALAGALITALVLGVVVLIWRRPTPPPVVVHPPPAPLIPDPATQASMPDAAAEAITTPEAIMVFVSGAVQTPGVYTLEANARVADALTAAGGLRDDASPAAVNQAAPLRDGDQVHVPTEAEAPTEPAAGVSGVPVQVEDAAGGLVNINTASLTELQTLPGIGPTRAEAIIANRPYGAVDDLDRVPGIGPATLESLRPLVRVN